MPNDEALRRRAFGKTRELSVQTRGFFDVRTDELQRSPPQLSATSSETHRFHIVEDLRHVEVVNDAVPPENLPTKSCHFAPPVRGLLTNNHGTL
eukprot:7708088-Pyramimonas_sp.AAC.1